VRLRPLDLLDLEPDVLEQLSQIADGRPPLGGESLPLLAEDCDSSFERGAETKMMQIDDARREATSNALGAAVNDGRLAAPDHAIAQQKLERLERNAGGERELLRRVRRKPRRAQVEHGEWADGGSVAAEATCQVSEQVPGVEARGPEACGSAGRAAELLVARPSR
jgi:hypothetical protein